MTEKTLNKNVTTISGKIVSRKDCVRIREEFHEKNVDCFEISDKWISKHYNNIELDEYTQQYNFRAKLGKGIKDLEWDNKNKCYIIKYGYSSKMAPKSIMIKGFDHAQPVLNVKIYAEFEKRLKMCQYSGLLFIDGRSNYTQPLKFNHKTDVFDHTVSLSKAKSMGFDAKILEKLGLVSKTHLTMQGLKYSFGIEIETCTGVMSSLQSAEYRLNVKTEKDGSVYTKEGDESTKYGGAEAITGVLDGDAGLAQLKNLCKVLSLRTKTNSTCSAHIHLGEGDQGKYTEEFILYLYILGTMIENELYSYMPRNRSMKDGHPNPYCKPLKTFKMVNMQNLKQEEYTKAFKTNFKALFNWLSSGSSVGENCNRNTNHPQGNKCGYDKNSARYSWLNLVPTYFNLRGGAKNSHTVEFRMFGNTTSYEKIKNWLLLCMAIVWFAENHQGSILQGYILDNHFTRIPITCETILKTCYKEQLASYLIQYYKTRQSVFTSNPDLGEDDFNAEDDFQPDDRIYTVKDIIEEAK